MSIISIPSVEERSAQLKEALPSLCAECGAGLTSEVIRLGYEDIEWMYLDAKGNPYEKSGPARVPEIALCPQCVSLEREEGQVLEYKFIREKKQSEILDELPVACEDCREPFDRDVEVTVESSKGDAEFFGKHLMSSWTVKASNGADISKEWGNLSIPASAVCPACQDKRTWRSRADELSQNIDGFMALVRESFPPEYREASMDQLSDDLQTFLKNWWRDENQPWSVYIYGNSSLGKTHTAYAFMTWIFETILRQEVGDLLEGDDPDYAYGSKALTYCTGKYWPDPILTGAWGGEYPAYIGVTKFLSLVNKCVTGKRLLQNPRRHLDSADILDPVDAFANHEGILLLDDFGIEKRSDFRCEALYNLIDHRYENKLPTIVTSLCPIGIDTSGNDWLTCIMERFRQGSAFELKGKNRRWQKSTP